MSKHYKVCNNKLLCVGLNIIKVAEEKRKRKRFVEYNKLSNDVGEKNDRYH